MYCVAATGCRALLWIPYLRWDPRIDCAIAERLTHLQVRCGSPAAGAVRGNAGRREFPSCLQQAALAPWQMPHNTAVPPALGLPSLVCLQ